MIEKNQKSTHQQLFFPILATLLLNSLIPFLTNIFLCRYSLETLEASVSSIYAIQIFQLPAVAMAMMAHVYVGRCKGAQEWDKIGPGVWQFIWASLLSPLLVVPLGILFGYYYYAKTQTEGLAWPYYLFLLTINFLYPLATSLSSFYLGRGAWRFITTCSTIAQSLQLLLSYLWIPTFGIMGVGYSILIAQGGLCCVLLCGFLSSIAVKLYRTDIWHLRPKLFWHCTKDGYFRAINRLLTLIAWAAAAHIVFAKGGEYAALICVGATFYALLTCFADATGQTQAIIVSQILGAKEFVSIRKSLVQGLLLAVSVISFLLIGTLCLQGASFAYLFPQQLLQDIVRDKLLFGVWLSISFLVLNTLMQAYIWAYRDGLFLLMAGAYNWIAYYVTLFVAFEFVNISPDQLWLWIGLSNFLSFLLPATKVFGTVLRAKQNELNI